MAATVSPIVCKNSCGLASELCPPVALAACGLLVESGTEISRQSPLLFNVCDESFKGVCREGLE